MIRERVNLISIASVFAVASAVIAGAAAYFFDHYHAAPLASANMCSSYGDASYGSQSSTNTDKLLFVTCTGFLE